MEATAIGLQTAKRSFTFARKEVKAMTGDLQCLQTAKRSFTFARGRSYTSRTKPRRVSKPLSGRSLLQEFSGPFSSREYKVSKPLSGRSLLQAVLALIGRLRTDKSPNR